MAMPDTTATLWPYQTPLRHPRTQRAMPVPDMAAAAQPRTSTYASGTKRTEKALQRCRFRVAFSETVLHCTGFRGLRRCDLQLCDDVPQGHSVLPPRRQHLPHPAPPTRSAASIN
eukprot:2152799-Rhodomonas_salina.1